jgi:SnoaL-like domain
MATRTGAVLFAVGVLLTASASAQAQTNTLTEQDRTAIRQLSDNYVTFLDGCKASEYAGLFTADGSFISGPRGTMTGRDKLASLVTSEPYCKPGAAPRNGLSHAFSRVVIDAAPDGARGQVYLPGRDAGTSGGHYEDRYVKTSDGWKFKSRTYLSPKEEQTAPAP